MSHHIFSTHSVCLCSFTFSLIFQPFKIMSVFIIFSRLMTKPERENLKMAWLCHSKSFSFLTFTRIPCQTSEDCEKEGEIWHARDSSQSDISKLACSDVLVHSSVSTPRSSHQREQKQRLTNHVNTLICHPFTEIIFSLKHHHLMIIISLGDLVFCVLTLLFWLNIYIYIYYFSICSSSQAVIYCIIYSFHYLIAQQVLGVELLQSHIINRQHIM